VLDILSGITQHEVLELLQKTWVDAKRVGLFTLKNALLFGLVLLSIGETQVKSCVSLVKRPVFQVFRHS
jgi:hypothetical protein